MCPWSVLVLLQAEKLVGKLDQLGATAGDLGLSLFKVAKFEVRHGTVLPALTHCTAGWHSDRRPLTGASRQGD